MSIITPQEEPNFVVLSRWSNLSSPPAISYHHAGANCSAEILLLEEIQG
jgi:hypothetical protein